MAITAVCDICGVTLRTPDKLSGRKVRCKECGSTVRLPGEPVADASAAVTKRSDGRTGRPGTRRGRAASRPSPQAETDEPDWLFERADEQDAAAQGSEPNLAALRDKRKGESGRGDRSQDDSGSAPRRMPPRIARPTEVGRPIRPRDEDEDSSRSSRRESRDWSGINFELSPLMAPLITFGICFVGSFVVADGPFDGERLRYVFLVSLLMNQAVAWFGSMSVISQEGTGALLICLFVPIAYWFYALSNFDEHKGWLGLSLVSLVLSMGLLLGEGAKANAARGARPQAEPQRAVQQQGVPINGPGGPQQALPRGRGPRNADEARDFLRGAGNAPGPGMEPGRRVVRPAF